MTPKEKANELLYNDFENLMYDYVEDMYSRKTLAKQCALVAVDELIKSSLSYDNYNATWASQVPYWKEVKEEIENI